MCSAFALNLIPIFIFSKKTFYLIPLNPLPFYYLCATMAKTNDEQFKNVISHAKEYGFVFQSSEIYDGLSAVYDYGQLGAELKNNIKTYWWKAMVQMHENIVGIDSAIFMHPKVWKASGHVDGFNDPMIDNKDSKKRYRADQLLEDKIARYEKDGKTEKAAKLQTDMYEAMAERTKEAIKMQTSPPAK